MFENSIKIDERLARIVEQTEKIPGYQVLSARPFWTPVVYVVASCRVLRPRRITLLEEYVLRAAIEFRDSPVTVAELAQLLGVDKRFLQTAVSDLQNIEALQKTADSLIASEAGIGFFNSGLVPQPPKTIEIELAFLSVINDWIMVSNRGKITPLPDAESVDGMPGFQEVSEADIEAILEQCTAQVIIDVTEKAGKPVHRPDEGDLLQEVENVEFGSLDKVFWALLIVHDLADETDLIQVRRWGSPLLASNHMNRMEGIVRELLESSSIEFADLLQVENDAVNDTVRGLSHIRDEDDTPDSNRAPKVKKLVQSEVLELRKQVSSDQVVAGNNGTAVLVRDSAIRPEFLEALKHSRSRVLIVSPWITEEAVDNELISIFDDLAQRRVLILLGWGIARSSSLESRVPGEKLLQALSRVKTPEGLPAVNAVWLGNQHSKDVIVDDRVHLCGSHNWLSYRGDHHPRGESVYKVTIAEQVLLATEVLENLFSQGIEEMWRRLATGTSDVEEDGLLSVISALININQFDNACRYAIQLAVSQGMVRPLSVLANAASKRLFGVSPEKRALFLDLLGSTCEDLKEGHLVSTPELTTAIRKLMKRAAQQERDVTKRTIETYPQSWQLLGVFNSDDSAEEFMNTTRSDPR